MPEMCKQKRDIEEDCPVEVEDCPVEDYSVEVWPWEQKWKIFCMRARRHSI